jgi:hypothetical protein
MKGIAYSPTINNDSTLISQGDEECETAAQDLSLQRNVCIDEDTAVCSNKEGDKQGKERGAVITVNKEDTAVCSNKEGDKQGKERGAVITVNKQSDLGEHFITERPKTSKHGVDREKMSTDVAAAEGVAVGSERKDEEMLSEGEEGEEEVVDDDLPVHFMVRQEEGTNQVMAL